MDRREQGENGEGARGFTYRILTISPDGTSTPTAWTTTSSTTTSLAAIGPTNPTESMEYGFAIVFLMY